MPSLQTCCDGLKAKIKAIEPLAQQAVNTSTTRTMGLRNLVNWRAGSLVTTPAGLLPSLGEIVGQINNFGGGFAEWSFIEKRTTPLAAITLPAAIANPDKAAVRINAVRMTKTTDYSIAGSTLTLTYPLNIGDILTVKTYGDG